MRDLTPYSRGNGLLNAGLLNEARALVVGIGGIGSYVALALAKLGVPHITLVDFDSVEAHNTGAQIYGTKQIDQTKTSAWTDGTSLLLPPDTVIETIESKFDREHADSATHIFACVDNMETREDIWKGAKTSANKPIVIDARIGGDFIRIHAADPNNDDDVEHYEESLYSSEEAEPLGCAERNIAYIAFTCAGLVTAVFADIVRSEEYPREIWHKAHDHATMKIK